MQFIRGHDPECWIAVFPPELMANGGNLDRVVESRGLLQAGNHSRRCHEKCHNNEDWDDGPSELNLIAAVHLGRLASIVILSLPELHDGVKQQGEDD
jgi:hypothetical protein